MGKPGSYRTTENEKGLFFLPDGFFHFEFLIDKKNATRPILTLTVKIINHHY